MGRLMRVIRGDDGKVYEAAMEALSKNYWPGGSVFAYNSLSDVIYNKPGAIQHLYQSRAGPGWYRDGFVVYDRDHFCPFDRRTWKHYITPNTICFHRFVNCWLPDERKRYCCELQEGWKGAQRD
jgi:hypothetical protein